MYYLNLSEISFSVNYLNIEWGQIDPKVTGGLKNAYNCSRKKSGKYSMINVNKTNNPQ